MARHRQSPASHGAGLDHSFPNRRTSGGSPALTMPPAPSISRGLAADFNTINAVDYALIALYFAAVIFVGFYAARKNRGTDDYFKAGGRVPWVLAGLSNWVTGFSAFMFVAAAGFTYRVGVGAILVFTM